MNILYEAPLCAIIQLSTHDGVLVDTSGGINESYEEFVIDPISAPFNLESIL